MRCLLNNQSLLEHLWQTDLCMLVAWHWVWSLPGYLCGHCQGTCMLTFRVLVWSLPGYLCGHCQGTCVVTARVLVWSLPGYLSFSVVILHPTGLTLMWFSNSQGIQSPMLRAWMIGYWTQVAGMPYTPRTSLLDCWRNKSWSKLYVIR